DGRRLVEQVKAYPRVGDALVAAGELAPLVSAGLQGLLLLPEVHRLGRRVDAVAGGAVEVQVDVGAVTPAQFHGPVDLLERRLIQPPPVLWVGPAAVRQRQADEVEAPLGQPGEVVLDEGPPGGDKLLEEVEPPPARELRGAGLGQLRRPCLPRHPAGPGRGGCHPEELTTIHDPILYLWGGEVVRW